jgi:hypothetical protein
MNPIKVFVESGERRTFAGAVDWLGWCRSDQEEKAALQALIDYAQVLQASGAQFQVPADIADLAVERHEGNSTTGFGAPTIVLGADREAMDGIEYERWKEILLACWGPSMVPCNGLGGRELRQRVEPVLRATPRNRGAGHSRRH